MKRAFIWTTHFEPIDTPSAGLIIARVSVQHLHHQPLTSILDTVVQECLNLLRRFGIRRSGEFELLRNLLEVLAKQCSPILKGFLEKRLEIRQKSACIVKYSTHLSIEIQQIETEQANPDFDILEFDVLTLPFA